MIARERRRDRRECDVRVSRSGKAVRRMELENNTERDGLMIMRHEIRGVIYRGGEPQDTERQYK